jgi:inosine/xanthosine triphosphate pyrophosphatase family protein
MGAGIQDVFGPSEHSSQPRISETFNTKLRARWRNAREITKKTAIGEDSWLI